MDMDCMESNAKKLKVSVEVPAFTLEQRKLRLKELLVTKSLHFAHSR